MCKDVMAAQQKARNRSAEMFDDGLPLSSAASFKGSITWCSIFLDTLQALGYLQQLPTRLDAAPLCVTM